MEEFFRGFEKNAFFWNKKKKEGVMPTEGKNLVVFHAKWSQVSTDYIKRLDRENLPGVTVVTIDVDKHPSLATASGVRGLPTTMLVGDGVTKKTWVGVQPMEEIKREL